MRSLGAVVVVVVEVVVGSVEERMKGRS